MGKCSCNAWSKDWERGDCCGWIGRRGTFQSIRWSEVPAKSSRQEVTCGMALSPWHSLCRSLGSYARSPYQRCRQGASLLDAGLPFDARGSAGEARITHIFVLEGNGSGRNRSDPQEMRVPGALLLRRTPPNRLCDSWPGSPLVQPATSRRVPGESHSDLRCRTVVAARAGRAARPERLDRATPHRSPHAT